MPRQGVIETERLILRPFTPDDAADVYEYLKSPAVNCFACMKLELLKANPQVCVEGDIFLRTETTDHGITTRYESVIGFGTCRIVENEQEIKHGLKVLTEHYGYRDYSLDRCRALEYLYVMKIVLDKITGKRNLPTAGDK